MTAELTTSPAANRRAEDDADRLINEFAALTEPGRGPGVTRLAYTPLEREAHALFADWMTELGLAVSTDALGNTVAERQGRASTSAIGTGSHLDSVPQGGRFDGTAGVVAAMLVARDLVEHDDATQHALRFVAFAGEEGARFGQACIGSKLAAGTYREADLYGVRDAQGVSVAEAITGVGLDPRRALQQPWRTDDWAGFIELHIEQGAVLHRRGEAIGIVDLISGSTRLLIEFTGVSSHTGATPMALRHDALAAAAETVLLAERLASDDRHRGTRATVGYLDVAPNSMTTIPGAVTMRVDIRDVDSDRQRTTALELLAATEQLCAGRGVAVRVQLLADMSPVVLPAHVRQVLEQAALREVGRYRVLTSGASHDTQMLASLMPVGMIFIPSRDGLSHVPDEWTSPAEIALGARVLRTALLALDAELYHGRRSQ